MTKHAPKKKFNSKARPKKNTDGVIHYDDAPVTLQLEMNKVMDAIDRTPDSFEAIISFGHPAIDRLGKLANEMIKVQGKFNNEVNVVAGALSSLETGLKGVDFDKLGQSTVKLLKGLAEGNATEDDRKQLADLQTALPKMLDEIIRQVDGLAGTDKGLKKVLVEAQKLVAERVEASRDLNLFLGSAKEVLRRYNEEYIPQAAKQFGESRDPEDEQYLKDVQNRKDDFIDRVVVIEGMRSAAAIAAQQLAQMVETMEDQRKKVRDVLDNSQNEWKALLSAAGIASTSAQAAHGIGSPKNDNAPASSATSDPKVGKPMVKKQKGPKHH
ncbi:MAG: toxic anion resistance protein [Alphaproteobacteria bacterium]